MPRPHCCRTCRALPGERVFKPRSIPMSELEVLRVALSEWEALRLCDLEGCDQAEAGQRMGVSRGTVQRLLKSGRRKLVTAILESKALVVEEGRAYENQSPRPGLL